MLFRLYLAGVVLALVFLGFLGGYAMGLLDSLSGTFVGDAMTAARALYTQAATSDNVLDSTRWNSRLGKGSGVVLNTADQTEAGLTLYTSGHDTTAMLIDMDGAVVHEWSLPFTEAWASAPHLQFVADQEFIFWRKAVPYPNGDLLALYDGEGVTPSGHGLAKIDKDSKLLWKYSETTHHDVRIGPDGNIYTLINTIQTEPVIGYANVKPPILDDAIVILSPDGEELQRISVLDAFSGTQYARFLLTIKPDPLGDYFHTNSLQPLSADVAAAFDFAEPGQILISMRELRMIALIDPDSGKIVWGMHGPWIGQHDADMLPNGNILIFDNQGGIGGAQGDTRVVEFNPLNQEVIWQFTSSKDRRLFCPIRSAQQRLPGGNTLITCSTSGQLLEVTRAGEVVWEFVNPVVGGAEDELLPIVAWGTRFQPSELPFLQR